MICHWYPEPSYFFFAPDLPGLLYYSHLPTIAITLIVGFFVFVNARHLLLNRVLFAIALTFIAWMLINLVAWTNIHSDFILFTWTLFGPLMAIISILCIYFIYVFLTKQDVPFKMKLVMFLMILPVLLFAFTDLNLQGFNLDWCDAFDYEGIAFSTNYSFLGIVAMAWIAFLIFKHYRTANESFRKQILIMGIGIEFFLFSFFTIVYLASLLAAFDFFNDSDLEFYGLFGMTIFMAVMAFMIVRFRTFNVGALTTDALVIALVILVGSQYTYIQDRLGIVLTTVTLTLTAIVGTILIRSVRKEVKQRKEIEGLADRLERANTRLKELDKMKNEFVSIASHQLRSPLTSVRGYTSMLMEGSYGQIPAKAMEAVERIHESSKFMATSIEDYLSVSRIEAGNMKYDYSDFNLKDEAEKIVDDLRSEATKSGILLLYKSSMRQKGIVHADKGKALQILHNLVNNALKYTQKGKITVFVHDDDTGKNIHVDVIDTGIGMSQDTISQLFGKFERAENANKVNVMGTGLGLYVARNMANVMGGDVTARSDGEGKGSTFSLILPLQM